MWDGRRRVFGGRFVKRPYGEDEAWAGAGRREAGDRRSPLRAGGERFAQFRIPNSAFG